MSETPCSWICYVINLDRSPHRLQSITQQMAQAGMPFERFPGIDGRLMGARAQEWIDLPVYKKLHGKEPTPGEIGCYASHISLMQAFLAGPHTHCMVLEDDALVPDNIRSVVDELVAVQDKWDMVLLFGNHFALPVVTATLSGGRELVGYFGKQTGAVAYMLNRKTAQAYVDHLVPMRLPLDHAFGLVWRLGIRMRGVRPSVIRYGDFQSEIGISGRKFPWYQRLGTYWARLSMDVRRFVHHLLRDPIWLEALLRRWRGR